MQLQQASDRFTQITQEIQSLLATIRSEVESSRGHFKGEAASSFQMVMNRYDGDANQLNQALQSIAEAISVSGKTFHETDETSRQNIAAAGSGLNL